MVAIASSRILQLTLKWPVFFIQPRHVSVMSVTIVLLSFNGRITWIPISRISSASVDSKQRIHSVKHRSAARRSNFRRVCVLIRPLIHSDLIARERVRSMSDLFSGTDLSILINPTPYNLESFDVSTLESHSMFMDLIFLAQSSLRW
jgi:hypothetical protein